ncbi:unnamed protein product [marine sediment metagenome]|uniref:Branched-chain amino acid aminotransferase n=1 Tax=marine sediment metagenome TaxID=412755 RepID=X1QN71_9ZZZZ
MKCPNCGKKISKTWLSKTGSCPNCGAKLVATRGITRDSIIKIANDEGISFEEYDFKPNELYAADEAFFTGTAAEVTPIREVDGKPIGGGKRGPTTEKLQQIFFNTVRGKEPKYEFWLDYVGK